MTLHSFLKQHLEHHLKFTLSKSKKKFTCKCFTCGKIIWTGLIRSWPELTHINECDGHELVCRLFEGCCGGDWPKGHEHDNLVLECHHLGCGLKEDKYEGTYLDCCERVLIKGPVCAKAEREQKEEIRQLENQAWLDRCEGIRS